MRVRRAIIALLLPVLMAPSLAFAAPAEQNCRTETWSVDPGKSGADFHARATDGCHVYEWTNVAGRGHGAGTVTFRTSHVMQVWEAGSTLPQPGGEDTYCAYQAADEANKMYVNYFQVPDGTEVTVQYSCR